MFCIRLLLGYWESVKATGTQSLMSNLLVMLNLVSGSVRILFTSVKY